MFLTTIPQPLGNYKNTLPVLKSVYLKKLNAIHIPNPQTMFRKNKALLFLSYTVIKAYTEDETLFCHQD